jgi:cobalt/nickel transport system permease protein
MRHSYLDEYSGLESTLSRLDARIKILTFFLFILFIIFTQANAYPAFLLYGLVLLALIRLSRIPWRFIFLRSLGIIPFVLMVAAFIPFSKKGGPEKIAAFWNVLLKSYFCIICVILLTASTRFALLLRALEKLRLPKIFTMILSFMYRYIFVVIDGLMEMKQAKDCRCAGGSSRLHLKALANILGVFFVRTYDKGEAVYLAMCARGFQGTMQTIEQFAIRKFDLFFFFAVIMALGAIKIFAG